MIPIVQVLLGEEEKAAVLRVMDSGLLAQGNVVKDFENKFAEFIGVKHAVAISTGTAALHTALVANGIGAGDEVITTPFSFIATANAIKMAGAKPVFVDVEEETGNIDPNLVRAAITAKTKAVLPVHLYGLPAEMESLSGICREKGLLLIEDACQAHGAKYQGKSVGAFGTGCFSFYATKNMATGEGGMITTQDDSVAILARKFIHHGSSERYYHDLFGYNYRMTNLAAAIGVEQLKKLPGFNNKRWENACYLGKHLDSIRGIMTPPLREGRVFHQFTIRVSPEYRKSRDELRETLLQKGVDSAIFYPVPIHQQKSYKEYNAQTFPVAERLSREVLSLPVHPALTKNDLDTIIRAFREIGGS